MPSFHRQSLIFDADDTLWENNIYFEDAFEQFCSYLSHSSLSPRQIREVLDEIELANIKIHGYGSVNFARNLSECYRRLAEREISDDDLKVVKDYAYAILQKPIELLPGVLETIEDLSSRHDMTLFTKGDPEEQKLKLDRSGLRDHFHHVAIVKEKNEAAYRRLASERGTEPERTWMIGNSPKSDINPALAAGLRAVFVPHPRTWSLEHEEVPAEHSRLLCVTTITDLKNYF